MQSNAQGAEGSCGGFCASVYPGQFCVLEGHCHHEDGFVPSVWPPSLEPRSALFTSPSTEGGVARPSTSGRVPEREALSSASAKKTGLLPSAPQVIYLRQFKALRALSLTGNPIAEGDDYKMFIWAYLPDLVYLDSRRIDDHMASVLFWVSPLCDTVSRAPGFMERDTETELPLYLRTRERAPHSS